MRRLALFLILLLTPSLAFADTSGPTFAGTGSNDSSFGTTAWGGPGNITADDTAFASASLPSGGNSQYLVADNFGFNLPGTATVSGIQFSILRKKLSGTGNCLDLRARVIKAGTIGTTDKLNAVIWSLTEASVNYGGASDLWGDTWTGVDINHADFGFALSVEESKDKSSTVICQVDYVTATITYSVTPSVIYGATLSGATIYNEQ